MPNIIHHIVPLRKAWTVVPDHSVWSITKDPASFFKEDLPIQLEYTESDLMTLYLANKTHLPGITLDPAFLDSVPAGWLTMYYHHIRYEGIVHGDDLPLRAGTAFATGVHRLSAYIAMERVLSAIVEQYAMTTNPEIKFKARNVHLIAEKIRWVIKQILRVYPNGDNPRKLIVGNVLEITGQVDREETRHIYLDRDTLTQYEADGGTILSAIEWYLTHGTQPYQAT